MMYRVYGALVASLGAVVLMLGVSEASARSGAAARGGLASTHSISRPTIAHSFRHHRRTGFGEFWPGDEGFYGPYGPTDGEPLVDATPPGSGNIHTTYTYDVPWDWAHRYPPAVTLSDRPYVSSCPTETVIVRGRGGGEQAVNVTRCY
ncbi:MAG TPA: hypothetical protein VN926_05605 [Bradyrhizobium sp.]|jgi:hypothetical protein|nr:hypothetical protein [Bradyrhizobium sp.]